MSLTAWRSELAARVGAATGLTAIAYPPPSITPPCVVLLVGSNYVTGPRRTGCVVDVSVTVRLVSDVAENAGAFDDVDGLIERALSVLAGFTTINVAARTYGNARYWCADITIEEVAAIPAVTIARAATAAPS